jgi:hypothetical protein
MAAYQSPYSSGFSQCRWSIGYGGAAILSFTLTIQCDGGIGSWFCVITREQGSRLPVPEVIE